MTYRLEFRNKEDALKVYRPLQAALRSEMSGYLPVVKVNGSTLVLSDDSKLGILERVLRKSPKKAILSRVE